MRLSEVIDLLGGLKSAAGFAGTSDETLANWRDGRRRPNFFGMQGLANAAGKSLDWLATGNDPGDSNGRASSQINPEALKEVLQLVDDWLQLNNRTMSNEKRAEVTATIYEMAIEEAGDEGASIDPRQVGRILRLVSG